MILNLEVSDSKRLGSLELCTMENIHRIHVRPVRSFTGMDLITGMLLEWTFIYVLEYFSVGFFKTNLPRMYTENV